MAVYIPSFQVPLGRPRFFLPLVFQLIIIFGNRFGLIRGDATNKDSESADKIFIAIKLSVKTRGTFWSRQTRPCHSCRHELYNVNGL